jgi:hypothetical protein
MKADPRIAELQLRLATDVCLNTFSGNSQQRKAVRTAVVVASRAGWCARSTKCLCAATSVRIRESTKTKSKKLADEIERKRRSDYAYSYDPNGRLSYKLFSLPNSTGSGVQPGVGGSGFFYDLAGNVTFTDLGNGVHLNQTRDGSGRTRTASSNKHTTSLLNNISSYTLFDDAVYTASGELSSSLLGNGLTETRNYDNRDRLTSNTLSQTGLANSYFFSVSYNENGTISQSNDAVNGSYLYGYDNLNRLTNAQSAGLSLSWKYDSFGNRWSQSAAGTGSAPQPSFTFNSNTNRADASGGFAGNVTRKVVSVRR